MTTKIKYYTKEEALQAVTENEGNLEFCSKELKNDEEVVMAAIKQGAWAFHQAHYKLKSNKTFILKALNEGVATSLVFYAAKKIKLDIEFISFLLEKSNDGWEFRYAEGKAALNKELAAKALVKWGNCNSSKDSELWEWLAPTLQEFFPEDSFYEKAQSYLNQIEQEKQAKLVSGGSTAEDEVVW